MRPVFAQAERELAARLRDWITKTSDGALRWTAHSYRSALVQIKAGAAELDRAMFDRLRHAGGRAQELAIQHLVEQVAFLSGSFRGAERLISVNASAQIAATRSYLVPRYRTSAARYAWGRGRVGVAADMQKRLATDILIGAPVHETVDRLVASGGPRGYVALRGVAGEENAIVEYIPEGLFARYRYWADRIVRTEVSSAYGAQGHDSMQAAAQVLPELRRRWMGDVTACIHVCLPMVGQVVGINDAFSTGMGDLVMYPPAHPSCGCTAVPFAPSWASLLDDIAS